MSALDACGSNPISDFPVDANALVASDAGAYFGQTDVRGTVDLAGDTFNFVDGFAFRDPTRGRDNEPNLKIVLFTEPVPHCSRSTIDGDNQAGALGVLFANPSASRVLQLRKPVCAGEGWNGTVGFVPIDWTLSQGSIEGNSQVVGTLSVTRVDWAGSPSGAVSFRLDYCGTLETARF